MKAVFLLFLLPFAVLGENCTPDNCSRDDKCVCPTTNSPISPKENSPQLVLLTFDDSPNAIDVDAYIKPLLEDRVNPDGEAIRGTWFVPHDYANYQTVCTMYNLGFEIGSNSITKSASEYWRNADYQTLFDEIVGQKEILNLHGQIPKEHIRGARIPYLEMRGDDYIEALQEGGFEYDSTLISLSSRKLFPYSLTVPEANKICVSGDCPKSSFPLWISPVNNIKPNNSECNALHGCAINSTASDITGWLLDEFNKNYNGQRAPFKLLVNAAFFRGYPDGLQGLQNLLDEMLSKGDVWIVTEWQAIQWMANPQDKDNFAPVYEDHNCECNDNTCQLPHGETSERWFYTCNDCPDVYPWVGNPEGNI